MRYELYIEGGGSTDGQKRKYAHAFREFLKRALPGCRHHELVVIARGDINQAIKDFKKACANHTADFIMLLVDSDGYVDAEPSAVRHYLQVQRQQTKGQLPRGVAASQIYLMVQALEAWFIADKKSIIAYYKHSLAQVSSGVDVERISSPKAMLKQATRQAGNDEYNEFTDGYELLLNHLNPDTIEAIPHGNRLLKKLKELLC